MTKIGSIAQGPHSHILTTGGVRVIFLGLRFWPKVIFFGGSMKDAGNFLGSRNKTEGFGGGGGCEERTKGFFGMLKYVVIFWVDKF